MIFGVEAFLDSAVAEASGWLNFLKELIVSAGAVVQDALQSLAADDEEEELHKKVSLLLKQA